MNKPRRTWDERIIDMIVDIFFFGVVIAGLDLYGIELDWKTGLGIVAISLIIAVNTILVGGFVYAYRYWRKSNG